jgi:hypothetical protein
VKKGEKHHYIPIFYLKQWRGPDGRLCEYSRPYNTVKPRRVHPDGTGYVRGLYTIDGLPPETANVIETKLLKPTDGLAANALDAFVHDRPLAKPAQMRTSLSRFVLSLMLRYPESIDEMKRQLHETVERVYAETRKETDPPTFKEYEAVQGTDELARLHGSLLLDLIRDSRMGRLIFGMHWGFVTFSQYGHSLLTSDRPITTNAFPISANHLCLPIGPRRMFFACDTEQAEHEFRRLHPKEIMRVINDLTARRAVKFIWGTDDRQLRFVEKRLRRA